MLSDLWKKIATDQRNGLGYIYDLHLFVYMEGDMTKRIIDIDDDYLAAASAALGSPTMKHAVNEALRLVAQIKTGLDHIDTLASGDLTDLADNEVMAQAWR